MFTQQFGTVMLRSINWLRHFIGLVLLIMLLGASITALLAGSWEAGKWIYENHLKGPNELNKPKNVDREEIIDATEEGRVS